MNYTRLIILSVFLISAIPHLHTQNEEEAWKLIAHESYNIEYPSDWEHDESGQMGSSFILFSPLSDESDNFKENVNLLIQDLSAYELTLDQYVEVSEEQIKTLVTDSNILLSERNREREIDFHKMIYTGKQGIFILKFQQFYWLINKKAYVLTLTCKESEYDKYLDIGERILNSFELK